MAKSNCWEFKNCGRQTGGLKAVELGICPATTEARTDGVNAGKNGGRVCWAIAGTLCGGKIQGTFADKTGNCTKCDFYGGVRQEEGADFKNTAFILAKMK